jgi:hypothetical protein
VSRKVGRRTVGRVLIAGALIGTSALAAGCGSSHPPLARTLKRDAAKTAAVGFKMKVAVRENVDGSGVIFRAQTSFTPRTHGGSMLMDMQAPAFGSGGLMPVVIANGTIYERLPSQLASMIPGGKPWLSLKLSQVSELSQLPGLNGFIGESLIFDDPMQYLDFIDAAAAGHAARSLGRATVNGVPMRHYRTRLNISEFLADAPTPDPQAAQALAQALKSQVKGMDTPVDLWIDRSGKVRRLLASVREDYAGHPVSVQIVEDITGYGPQPVPAPPSPAETTNLLSLVAAFNPTGSVP